MNTEYPSSPHCLKVFGKPGSNTTNNNRHKGCKKNPANLSKKRKCPISNYFVKKTCQAITPTVYCIYMLLFIYITPTVTDNNLDNDIVVRVMDAEEIVQSLPVDVEVGGSGVMS